MPADPRFAVHDLLRLRNIDELHWADRRIGVWKEESRPDWAWAALHRAPWVVVRRTAAHSDLLPVGVRGDARHQRAAAWLPVHSIERIVTPQILARHRAWLGQPRTKLLPALQVLDDAAAIFGDLGFEDLWGPVGGVGFELASGVPSVSAPSDLDLVLDAPEPIEVRDATALLTALERLSARVDLLLETPLGAVALSDYASGKRAVLLRTQAGPRLVADPWHASWAAGETA
jgi:phosphoribosyl-dephospho-CoA transferase